MNNIYICKVTRYQSEGNQIDIPKSVAINFFNIPQENLENCINTELCICHASNTTEFEQIAIQPATNVRWSTKLNSFLSEKGNNLVEGDLLKFEKIGRMFSVECIKADDEIYAALLKLFVKENQILLSASPNNLSAKELSSLQIIYFGAPGTGKSHNINKTVNDYNSIRTTFHPDSDYSTFVGCYKPMKNPVNNEITYEFVPQAFTTAYVKAWSNLDYPYYLVIEEINRGNCAQVFGDIFQLLDRNNTGYSSYKITPDMDLQQYLCEKFEKVDIDDEDIKKGVKMQLPANLHILATMNTSDQSLFPIDSAFKRRWDWKYIPIDYTDKGHYISCGEKQYMWVDFLEKVNVRIESVTQSEDKKMGGWFVKPIDKEITADKFVSKVVFYLWNDIFKDFAHNGNTIFKNEFKNFNSFFDYNGDVKESVLESFLDSLEVIYIKTFSDEDYEDSTLLSKAKYTYNGERLTLGGIANKVVSNYALAHSEMDAVAIRNYFVNLCSGIGIAHIVETDDEYQQRATQKSAERSRTPLVIPNGETIHVSTQWRAKNESDNFIRFIEICRNNKLGDILPIE